MIIIDEWDCIFREYKSDKEAQEQYLDFLRDVYKRQGNNITMGQAIKYARKGSVIVLVAVFAGMAEICLLYTSRCV